MREEGFHADENLPRHAGRLDHKVIGSCDDTHGTDGRIHIIGADNGLWRSGRSIVEIIIVVDRFIVCSETVPWPPCFQQANVCP